MSVSQSTLPRSFRKVSSSADSPEPNGERELSERFNCGDSWQSCYCCLSWFWGPPRPGLPYGEVLWLGLTSPQELHTHTLSDAMEGPRWGCLSPTRWLLRLWLDALTAWQPSSQTKRPKRQAVGVTYFLRQRFFA